LSKNRSFDERIFSVTRSSSALSKAGYGSITARLRNSGSQVGDTRANWHRENATIGGIPTSKKFTEELISGVYHLPKLN